MCAMMTLPFLLLGGFVLMLHVGSTVQSCAPPTLMDGYIYPHQALYSDEDSLTYACNPGHKPVVEGWWATITCKKGRWSAEPLCINEKSCIEPSIPNAEDIEVVGSRFEVTCKKGYYGKEATCENGTWTDEPVCEKSNSSCAEPPQVPHAVIILQHYQEVFSAGTELQYKCEEGYRTETGTIAQVSCSEGKWSAGPTCQKTVIVNDGSTTVTPSPGFGLSNCGEKPFITNSEIVETGSDYLKYQCASYYKLEGSDIVKCLNFGIWSPVPTCREAFCYVNSEDYPFLKNEARELLGEGDKKKLTCAERYYGRSQYSEFQCMNGIVKHTDCCTTWKFNTIGCALV